MLADPVFPMCDLRAFSRAGAATYLPGSFSTSAYRCTATHTSAYNRLAADAKPVCCGRDLGATRNRLGRNGQAAQHSRCTVDMNLSPTPPPLSPFAIYLLADVSKTFTRDARTKKTQKRVRYTDFVALLFLALTRRHAGLFSTGAFSGVPAAGAELPTKSPPTCSVARLRFAYGSSC